MTLLVINWNMKLDNKVNSLSVGFIQASVWERLENLEHTLQPSAFPECSTFTFYSRMFYSLRIGRIVFAAPQPSARLAGLFSLWPLVVITRINTLILCVFFLPVRSLPYLRLHVWLRVGTNTRHQTGLTGSAEWAPWSGWPPDPARCRRQTVPLAKLFKGLLTDKESTPSNLISRLLLSETGEVHLLRDAPGRRTREGVAATLGWMESRTLSVGFECEWRRVWL